MGGLSTIFQGSQRALPPCCKHRGGDGHWGRGKGTGGRALAAEGSQRLNQLLAGAWPS